MCSFGIIVQRTDLDCFLPYMLTWLICGKPPFENVSSPVLSDVHYKSLTSIRMHHPRKFAITQDINWSPTLSRGSTPPIHSQLFINELSTSCAHGLIQAICCFHRPPDISVIGQRSTHTLSSAMHFAPVQSVPVDFMDQWIGFPVEEIEC